MGTPPKLQQEYGTLYLFTIGWRHYAMMTVVCLSVCLSICLSDCLFVQCLTLSRERKGVLEQQPEKYQEESRVTRNPIPRSKGRRSRSLGLRSSKFCHQLLPPAENKYNFIPSFTKIRLTIFHCNMSHDITYRHCCVIHERCLRMPFVTSLLLS